MSMMLGVILGVAVIATAIMIHEAGHLMAAKALRIPVKEFAVGFGPRLIAGKWRGTVYTVRLVLVGGYVLPDQEAFDAAPAWKRILVFAAGPAVNLLTAVAIVTAAGLCLGAPPAKSLAAGFAFLGLVAQATVEFLQVFGVQAVGGPLAMSYGYGYMFANQVPAVEMALVGATLHATLGLVNLLPLPVLDGGQILAALVRLKPTSRAYQLVLTANGVLIFVTFAAIMAYDAWRIVTRSFPGM